MELMLVALGLLVGFIAGQSWERWFLRGEKASLVAQGELLTKVHAYGTPQEAREWKAILEPVKAPARTDAENIERSIRAAVSQHDELRGSKISVDRDTKRVTLINHDPANPIALHDYPEEEIVRYLNSL